MGELLSSLAALFITLPALLYFIIFIPLKIVTKNKRKAMNAAVNVTTFSLIFSIHFLILAIWNQSLFWVIALFMLITAVSFTILYWRIREEIIYPKVFLGYWRLNFLLFSVIYIGLLLYGITTRAIEAVQAAI
jgi:hypothetical protein